MARVTRDDIDKFLDRNVDIPGRTIILTTYEVDYDDAKHVLKALHLLDRTDGTITIKMDNPGGDWYNGMAIYDAIRLCQNDVRIVVYGQAMSMGAVILQAADERVLAENATVMVHYGSDAYWGDVKNFERRAEESKRGCLVMENIFLRRIHEKNPTYTVEDFRKQFEHDTFMSAREAVEMGLADEVI